MAELDVYRDWLKIPDSDRPLTHYQLLRLKQFEDDPEKIRGNYRKLNAHVRKFSTGEYEAESQELLNELAKAMLCLTDAERKEEYDASLGRSRHEETDRRSLDELLVIRAQAPRERMAEAEAFAKATNMPLHVAVVQKKLCTSAAAMQAYAESLGLPYLDLADVVVSDELLGMIPAVTARQHSCVPVLIDEGHLLIAAPHLEGQHIEEELRMKHQMPVNRVLCTPASINQFITEHYPREKAEAEHRARNAADRPVKEPGKVGIFFKKVAKWVKENSKKK